MALDRTRLLALTVTSWPDGTAIDEATGQGACIESARLLVDALRRLGISDARALAVDVVYGNAASKAVRSTPIEDWPPEAYTVGAVIGDPGITPRSAREPGRRKGFVGHVVVVGEDWLIDMTAQQFHRPDHGIVIEGAVCAGGLDGISSKQRHELELDLPEGGWVRYVTRPEVKSYRTSNAWRNEVGLAEATDVLVERVLTRASSLEPVTE